MVVGGPDQEWCQRSPQIDVGGLAYCRLLTPVHCPQIFPLTSAVLSSNSSATGGPEAPPWHPVSRWLHMIRKRAVFIKLVLKKDTAENAYNWFCELIRTPTSKGICNSVFQYLITTTLIQTGLINFRILFNTQGGIKINISTALLMQYMNLLFYFLIYFEFCWKLFVGKCFVIICRLEALEII